MAKTKQQKKEIIDDLGKKLKKQKSVVLADFSGTSAQSIFKLRSDLKEQDAGLTVVKKTLLKKLLGDLRQDNLKENIEKIKGQLALVFGFKEETAPAKICKTFQEKNPSFKILGGVLEEKFLSAEDVLGLAELPARPELLALLLGALQSPESGFVRVLQGNIKGLITVLSKIKQ